MVIKPPVFAGGFVKSLQERNMENGKTAGET